MHEIFYIHIYKNLKTMRLSKHYNTTQCNSPKTKKNELPQAGLEPTTFCILHVYMYILRGIGSVVPLILKMNTFLAEIYMYPKYRILVFL